MFTFKSKSKSSNDCTDANDPTVKRNRAGVGSATASFSQVISMCVVPVRVKHSDSRKFVTEDLISKFDVSGVKTSIISRLQGTNNIT